MRNHENVNVRLMIDYLEGALKSLEKGNLADACTYTRLAYSFQGDIPNELRLGKKI
jgi:hypothetical protein